MRTQRNTPKTYATSLRTEVGNAIKKSHCNIQNNVNSINVINLEDKKKKAQKKKKKNLIL